MKKNYIEMLTNILTKEGAFGDLKKKFREVASQKKDSDLNKIKKV